MHKTKLTRSCRVCIRMAKLKKKRMEDRQGNCKTTCGTVQKAMVCVSFVNAVLGLEGEFNGPLVKLLINRHTYRAYEGFFKNDISSFTKPNCQRLK